MIRWLLEWWYERQRRLDILILWPQCKNVAPTIDLARAAFAFHAFRDPAWLALGEDEIRRSIDAL